MSLSKVTKALAAIAAGIAVLVTPGFARADAASGSNPADIAYVSHELDKLGVTPEVRDRLIDKLFVKATLWDSLTGAEPVSSESKVSGRRERIRHTYADGSVAEAVIDLPVSVSSGGVTVKSIRNCTEEVNQYIHAYYGCTVDWNAATWHMNFYADYNWHQTGASVSNIRNILTGGVGIQDDERVEYLVPRVTSGNQVAKARALVSQKLTVGGVGLKSKVGILLEVCSAWSRKAKESPVNI